MSTVDFWQQQRAQLDESLAQAADLRGNARAHADAYKEKALAAVERKHGRRPRLEPFHLDRDAGVALRMAEDAEGQYIRLSHGNAPSEVVREAWGAFVNSFSAFVDRATAGWPSASDYQAAQDRAQAARFASPYMQGR